MRVGINGRFLVAKRTGVQRAAYNLIKTMVELDRENEYFIFTGMEQIGSPDWNYSNVTVVGDHLRSSESFRNHLWEQFKLPRLAREYKIDILHSPANIAPLFYRGKSIVHIHDLCFVVNPQWYSFSFRTLYNLIIPRIAKRATKVITNSNNSKNDLLQYFGLPAERVSLVYWAVDEIFSETRNSSFYKSQNFSGPADYILYVGSLEPRKNINLLIGAFEELRSQHPELKTKLILIGGESPLFAAVRLKAKRFRDDVIFKGFVKDEELREFYCRAKLVAYPSLYEGFGLPPLEAMASGTPVVTSRTSSIPEVVADAAIMVDPHDSGQLVSAMYKVLTDKELSDSLRRRGLEQVKKFNWYRVARGVLGVYYEVHLRKNSQPLTVHSFMPQSIWAKIRKREAKV
ncbi:MAG: glycosyltransferase family 1 protein [Proteobacteria bacterium]|nr:glycosyltransferase family 1 protein [Pseudomonadota bacterium]